MNRSTVLFIDALINLILGVLLVVFPAPLVQGLGVPDAASSFYPSILGAVLFGVGIALMIEWRSPSEGLVGLGLGGAVAINLCGGVCLAGWMLLGHLEIPTRGHILLWGLVVLLVGISVVELGVHLRQVKRRESD